MREDLGLARKGEQTRATRMEGFGLACEDLVAGVHGVISRKGKEATVAAGS